MSTDPGGPTEGDERLFSGYSGRVFVVVTIGLAAVKIGKDAIPPLLPAITADLGISPVEAGVALSMMAGCYALVQYPSGRLADELSSTTVLLASMLVASLALVVLASAVSYAVFLLGIVTLGVGWGFYSTPQRTILSKLFVERRGRAFGINMAAGDVAGVTAAGLAVAVLSVTVWRAAFLPLVLVLLPLPLLLRRVSEEPVHVGRVELGLRETGGRIVRHQRLAWLVVAYVLYVFTLRGVIGFLPTLLQADLDFSPALAGIAYGVLFATGMAYKPLAGYASDQVRRPVVAASVLFVGAGGLVVMLLTANLAVVFAGLLVYTVGHKGFGPVMQAHLMDSFPDESMGGDLGAVRTVYMTLGSLGPAYVGLVASRASYRVAFAGFVGCFLIAGAITLWLDRQTR